MKDTHKTLLWTLLFGGIMFVILYWRILFDGYTYLFADIGCDTYLQYYPSAMMSRLVQENGDTGNYLLQNGFGNEYSNNIWNTILGLFGWVSWLIPTSKLHLLFIVSNVLRYLWILVFPTLHFQRLFKSQKAVFITAVIFTYSGWLVLWGSIPSSRPYGWLVLRIICLVLCNNSFL